MTTITTRQGKGSALTYEEMDANLTNLNDDKLETAGGTLTGDLTFSESGTGIVFSDSSTLTSAAGLVVDGTLPAGGATNDILAKSSGDDYDAAWTDAPTLDAVQLDTAAAEAAAVGKLWWNATKETLSIGLDVDCVMNVGQHTYIYGKAAEAITKGQVVMFGGVQGDHILLNVADASAEGFVPEWIIGIASDTLATNDFGHVVIIGEVTDIDTATDYNQGDILWFDPATPGGLTATEPDAPNAKVRMAAVTKENATEGILLVRVGPSKSLSDLNDVNTSGASDNDFLVYDSAAGVWEHEPLDISLDTSPTLGGSLAAAGYNITGVTKIVGESSTNLVIDGGNNGTQKNISFVGDIDLWEPTSQNASWITNTNLDYNSTDRLLRFKTSVGGSGWSGSTSGNYQGRVGSLSAWNNTVPAITSSGNTTTPSGYTNNWSSQTNLRFGQIVGGLLSSSPATAAHPITGTNVFRGTQPDYATLTGLDSGTYTPANNDVWWIEDESKFYKYVSGSWAAQTHSPNDTAVSTNSEGFRITHSVEPQLFQQTRLGDADRQQALFVNLDVSPNGEQWGSMSGSGWGREQAKVVAAQSTIVNNGNITSVIPYSATVELRPHGLVANSGSDTLTIYGITGQSLRVGWTNQTASGSNRPVSTTVNNVAGLRVGTYNTGTFTVSGYTITNTIDNYSGLYWANGSVVATNKYSLNVQDSSVTLRNDGPIQTTTTLTVGNYASTAMPTGSIGMIVAVNDAGGKLAYWDTANSRWSYVADDSAV